MTRARDLMDKLIAFPTVSRESNLALIDFVESILLGLAWPQPVCPNARWHQGRPLCPYRAAGRWRCCAVGPHRCGPCARAGWDTDPFTVTEKDGKLYGRGTCDMKGFDALALSAVPLALERGIKRPLQIALSYDEEIGCLGAPPMIDHMVSHGMPRADTVIVGEPSMMQVVTGHKGGIGWDMHFRGFEVHSSLAYQGVSAIMMAAKMIEWCNKVNAETAAATPSALAAAFDPPYTGLACGHDPAAAPQITSPPKTATSTSISALFRGMTCVSGRRGCWPKLPNLRPK